MCRDSSLCAEKPKVIVGRSPLNEAPDMNGTNSRLVSRYSKREPDGDEELERARR